MRSHDPQQFELLLAGLETMTVRMPVAKKKTPANAPFFSVSNRTAVVADPLDSATKVFYRVRVFAP